ncbi:MAG: hypothetical protein AAB372_01855 [Patescibacteria group bacterium]
MVALEHALPLTGRLLNAVVVLIIALSSFSLGWSILKSGFLSRQQKLFAYFWIATGFLWISSTIRNVFSAYEIFSIDKLFFYGSQLFLYVSGVFLAPYLINKIVSGGRTGYIVQGCYILLGFFGFIATLIYGIEALPPDFFSTKYFVLFPASLFAIIAMAPMIIVSILETVYEAIRYMHGNGAGHEVLSVLSIVMYVSVGVIDQIGFVVGWNLIALRLVYLVAFLIAYGAVAREKESHAASQEEHVFYVS